LTKTRKSPRLHKVKSHIRNGRKVKLYTRGKGNRNVRKVKKKIKIKKPDHVYFEDVSKDLEKLNRKYGVKGRIIGGLLRKGKSKNDIDIMFDKPISSKLNVKIGLFLYKKYGKTVDIFTPITQEEIESIKEGDPDPMVGWEPMEEVKADYALRTYSDLGFFVGWTTKSGMRRTEGVKSRMEKRRKRFVEVDKLSDKGIISFDEWRRRRQKLVKEQRRDKSIAKTLGMYLE
jgi:hypothetical protein